MKLRHNSRLARYRTPFGAVTAGTEVTLTLEVVKEDAAGIECTLRTWIDGVGEQLYPMAADGSSGYRVTVSWSDPNIVWYSFIVRTTDGFESRVGAPEGHVGGEGVTYYDRADVPSFQITVYRHRAQRPTWYERGIVYQIFPDRFARDDDWRTRALGRLAHPRRGCEQHIVEDWDTPPVYDRDETGAIRSWDFYGGSLRGIEEHLPYLSEMGVTAIYLNPIFEAASNHRYDTADYMRIDQLLGTEEDFRSLCWHARALGISIILDGVFNHTGSDSVYFNAFGNYPEPGAWSGDEDSLWRDAFRINDDGTYDCWWGVGNMPAVNQGSEAISRLILGPDGVIRHWLRAGASGWRLDVADELSDEFLAGIKEAATREKPDALVLGEVWEDASNKISYGRLRRYLLGDELDSAMNYPFRDLVIGLLTGEGSGYTARDAAEAIESLVENYPPEALDCALNLLGSHDRPRIISVLGGLPDIDALPERERGTWRLTDEQLGLAKGRFWLAALMQMTFKGVPSIYYGDEAGVQGLTDPGNRATFPWGHEDRDFFTMVRNASALRRALPLLTSAPLEAEALDDDVLSYTRDGGEGESATVVVNRSTTELRKVRIPFRGERGVDVIGGADLVRGEDGTAELSLWPLGSAVAYFHEAERLQKPLERGWGVVCHITSVPNEDGRPGTLGAPARAFVDHLAEMGARYWQVLPVNPTDSFGSPYAGPSAFAGSTDLLEETPRELEAAYERFKSDGGQNSADFIAFQERNEVWLDPYCAFMAVRDASRGASRHRWPRAYSRYDVRILDDARFIDRGRFHAFAQYRFDAEWAELRAYANARGIEIVGDIPMYVSDDSADAWSEPAMFSLSATGRPTEIAGTPPDRFSATGQVWGNPTYRWDRMREDGYTWWIERLRRSLALYDRVRLDHFLGFQSYFNIPAGKEGSAGRWLPGPGIDLFRRAHEEFGPLPFIAEDLGYLTPAVRALTASCGFPGMDVLEFEDYDVRGGVKPAADKVVYTSTHDTSTLLGWTGARWGADATAEEREGLAASIMRSALESSADLVMMPLQDVLMLGDDARMNVPGTTEGNWSWQADEADVAAAVARIRSLVEETGRL